VASHHPGNSHLHRDPGSTDDNKLDPAVITGDTKKPTIIKVNQEAGNGGQAAAANSKSNSSQRGRSRANSTSSSSNNNPSHQQQQHHVPISTTPTMTGPHPRNGEWIQHQETQRNFARNTSARSSRSVTGSETLPPPRPYKSPELSPYANLDQRAFMNNPKNQVLPSPGGSLPSNHRSHPPPTTYSSVRSNSKVVEYNEKRVNGEIVSQSVHKQEKMNQA